MNNRTWPFNLWDDIIGSAPSIDGVESIFPEEAPHVLYWPNVDDVLTDALDERAQQIIRMRYEQGMKYQIIAEKYGIGTERVRQIISHSLRKLRAPQYYGQLSAIPKNDLLPLMRENRQLATENEALKEQISKLSEGMESYRAARQSKMPHHSPVAALDLSKRSLNCLYANEIRTVGDLINQTESQLKVIPRLGAGRISEIKRALARFDYELEPEQ